MSVDTLTDSFTATTVDGTAQLITITINGANDAAVISGAASGSVTEAGGVANGTPGIPTTTGDLNSADVDNLPDTWTAVSLPTPSDNGYGTFTLTAAGVWTYTLDNGNAAVQALNIGGTLSDSITVTTVDGTQQVVTIAIDGANDAAVITGAATGTVVEAGGINNGTPGTPVANGDLDAADVDNTPDSWLAINSPTAGTNGFGTFTLTAAGVWTYTLDNANAAVQALNIGGTLTDSFTTTTIDGTTQTVDITINGFNDAPFAVTDTNAGDVVIESGVNPGNTPFTGDPSAAGNVLTNDTDVDSGDFKTVIAVNGSALNVGQPLVGTYGTLTLLADGSWSYALNNADPDTNALAQGQTATDVFTYTMADAHGATSSTSLTITLTGTNDAPDITAGSGDSATATLTETDAGLTTSGTLTLIDPDLTDTVTASVSVGHSRRDDRRADGRGRAGDAVGDGWFDCGQSGRHAQSRLDVQLRRAGVQLPERGRGADAYLYGAGHRRQRHRHPGRDDHHQRHERGAGGKRRHRSGVQPDDSDHPVERAACQRQRSERDHYRRHGPPWRHRRNDSGHAQRGRKDDHLHHARHQRHHRQ